MGVKLNYMKYFFILFLAIVSCKENKILDKPRTTVEQEVADSNVPFYNLFLKHEAEQELSNKFSLDTSKYFKTYVLQGRSKLIEREFEDINPSDILSEAELYKLNYHTVFENYQSDFINMYEFNAKKFKTNKTEIVYFFTYPFSVSKNKVLIGLEVIHKPHSKESSERVYIGYMEFIVFEKINDTWNLISKEKLLEY
jgi:hypothetical protein